VVRKEFQIKILNGFAALENRSVSEDVNKAWKVIKEIIESSSKESLCLHEYKQHNPWMMSNV
jgi:glucose-6-phosphate 1-dehydrogenase